MYPKLVFLSRAVVEQQFFGITFSTFFALAFFFDSANLVPNLISSLCPSLWSRRHLKDSLFYPTLFLNNSVTDEGCTLSKKVSSLQAKTLRHGPFFNSISALMYGLGRWFPCFTIHAIIQGGRKTIASLLSLLQITIHAKDLAFSVSCLT